MPEGVGLGTAGRVCIIAHSHADITKGGGEVAAYREFQTLRAAGVETTFVGASEVNTRYAERRAAELVMPYAPGEYVYAFAGMAPDRLGWEDAVQRRTLVEFLAGLDAEVYHFHHYWRVGADLIRALMAARPDARFVITLHEMLAICLHHGQMIRTQGRELCRREAPVRCLACFPEETIERLVLRKAFLLDTLRRFDAVLYPSAFLRGRYEEWGLRAGHAAVLENYVGDEMMALPRDPAAGTSQAARFGFFGQPTPYKGLDVLLQGFALALRQNPDLTLSVFGTDRETVLEMYPALTTTIEDAGSAVAFLGRYDAADTIFLMRAVGWAVMPSIWWENSPVVIQEAKRAGTPLIVADIGGMAEKVTPGVDGLHFRRASPVDLARALLEAAEPETRARIGASLTDTLGRDAFLDGLGNAFAGAAEPRRGAEPHGLASA
jgi:glycosyltransferase involved in cell wall biosynthesis